MELSVLQVVGNSATGGAEHHVRQLVHGLLERGVRVEVICPRPGPLVDELARDGVRVDCREFVVPRANDDYDLDGDAFAWFTRQIAERRPDVVHTHLYPAHLHATLAGDAVGVPAIVHTA